MGRNGLGLKWLWAEMTRNPTRNKTSTKSMNFNFSILAVLSRQYFFWYICNFPSQDLLAMSPICWSGLKATAAPDLPRQKSKFMILFKLRYLHVGK